jgi:hypothetical protein
MIRIITPMAKIAPQNQLSLKKSPMLFKAFSSFFQKLGGKTTSSDIYLLYTIKSMLGIKNPILPIYQ